MTSLAAILALATAAAPAAGERIAVIAVHDASGPDGELSELTHQLRAACTERAAGVVAATDMRAHLAGRTGGATVAELDRAFGGALAVYQNGEFESAARTLKAIIEDLEELPESEAVWNQWTRAMMRLSHVYLSMTQPEEVDAVQIAVLKVDSGLQLDPVLYAPGFRAHFDELRHRVRAMPKRRLTVTARGRAGTIYVGGRDIGPTPATVVLPVGTYRVGGAAGPLRIPSFTVDLGGEDRAVVLDFALAEAFRPSAGPGLVLGPTDRASAIIRTGAWLGVERLVVASRAVEGEAHFLVGSIYDVRRGALLREGSVRMVSGGVPAVNLGALAAFLLTGQSSREVLDRRGDPLARAAPRPPPGPVAPVPPPTPAPRATVATAAAPSAVPGSTAAPALPPAATSTTSATAAASHPAAPVPPAARPADAVRSGPPRSEPGRALAPAAARGSASPPVAEAASVTPGAPAPDLHAAPPAPDPAGLATAVAEREHPAPARWMRPTAIGSGVLGAALAAFAVQQGLRARSAYADADAMVVGGRYQPGASPETVAAANGRGDSASRRAWLLGGTAFASAGAAAVLTWWSRDPAPSR